MANGLRARLQWFGVILACGTTIFIFLTYPVSSQLQRIISGPILRLAHHMQTVSREKNYAIKAKKSGNDEVGILIDGFNEMLEQTQIRDEELSRQSNRLSELVSKRTEELKISEEQKQQLLFQQIIQEAYGQIVELLNTIDISEILEKSLNEIVNQTTSGWGAFYLAGENSHSLKLTKSISAETVKRDWPDDQVNNIFREDVLETLDGDCVEFLLVSVSDNGIGIKEESFKSIFEVFQQEDKSTTTKFGGTGLGPSLCKQFIALHNGGIWVDSSPGEGSTFSFLLPIYATDPSQKNQEAVSRSTQSEKPLVLVVDDDEKICALIAYLLKEEGCDVQTSLNGQSAIEKSRALEPDIIFLDVMLPKRSGWEVLNQLKSDEKTADIPVVICSAIEDRRQALSLGATDSIVKPVMKDDIVRSLKNAGLHSAGQTQSLAI